MSDGPIYVGSLEDDAEQLYELAPCGYLSTTPDGVIVKVNRTFELLTGYGREQLVAQRRFVDLLTAGGRIYHETHYAPMLSMQDHASEIAFEIIAANGARVPVLVNSVLEREADGSPKVVRTAVFDATDRREYERELLRATRRAEESEARATALARTLQQTLIPPSPPDIPGLDLAAVYRPAGDGEEVGGDFYDVFEVANDDWIVVIGDVCGKGVDAAVVTALARYTIRAEAIRVPRPAEVLKTLNDVMLRHETDRFCTVAILRMHRMDGGWNATMSVGGHPLGLIATAAGGLDFFGTPGLVVGVFDDARFEEAVTRLEPGDALVLYTDGVTEARIATELFGDDRLCESIAAHAGSAASLSGGILADVMAYQGDNPRDDIAIVAVRVPRVE
jgi:sigma-B regulation protein RsbU (phosphoserine phosphatase)